MVQLGISLSPRACWQALSGGYAFDRLDQLRIVLLSKGGLRCVEAGEAALGAPAGGDVKVIRIQCGVRTGEDDRLRGQRRDIFRHTCISRPRGFDLTFAPAPHRRYDHWGMGDHVSRCNGHVFSSVHVLV